MTFNIKHFEKGNAVVSLDYEPFTGIYDCMMGDSNGCEVYRIEKRNRTLNRTNALATFRRYKKEINER